MLWHPKNFNLVLLIKILPGNLNFYFLAFLLVSGPFFTLLLWSFYLKWRKTFQIYYWTCLPFQNKHFYCQGNLFALLFVSELYSLKWFFISLELFLNYHHLINSFKISTKIWRCHVMFLNHFYARIYFTHLIFWALHQVFKTGPDGSFALQPLKIFLSSLRQNYGMLIGVYYSALCKNPFIFFEKFEWINLFFILVQLGDLYCIPN